MQKSAVRGTANIDDALGKSLVYGLYCVKDRASLGAEVVEQGIHGVGIKGFEPLRQTQP
ncbi:MAG: hypothetical protein ACR2RL_21950 [Gammaproteobacteria bacterium]